MEISLAERLCVARNEVVRQAMAWPLRLAVPLVRARLHRRIRGHRRQQDRLRKRYGIEASTPILSWGPEVEQAVDEYARRTPDVRFAYTSGSTARPKKLAFTPARLRAIERGSWEAAVQAGRVHRVGRPTSFVLAALKRGDSLSSLMLETPGRAGYLEALVRPSKLLGEPAWAELLDRFGPTACRLLLLVLSNPSFVSSANPATLAVFLSQLDADWPRAAALTRHLLSGESAPPARDAIRRVGAPGWFGRARRVAEALAPPPLEDYLPALRGYACWDGGYVTPLLERIRTSLPAPRFVHVPMYSTATETVETQTYYDSAGRPHFFPIAPRVLYEFLPEGAPDDPQQLLRAHELEPGQRYCMVVSDPYGLRRYQTGDLFLCQERVRGLPDLRFVRRRGLSYSFTGEELTGEQVQAACAELRERFPPLAQAQLTLIPSLPREGSLSQSAALPHYRLVIAWLGARGAVELGALGKATDELLRAKNEELAAKRTSLRLGPVRAVSMEYDQLARHIGGGHEAGRRGWEAEFTLLPLYTRTWQELGLPDDLRAGAA